MKRAVGGHHKDISFAVNWKEIALEWERTR